jgi:hypothetical protein
MLSRLLMACIGLALLHTQAIADSQYLGAITMYLCDGGEDLCGNTLISSPINLPLGPFTEDFVFDMVNDFTNYPDDLPLLQTTVQIETDNQADFIPGNVQLYDPYGMQVGYPDLPFVFTGSGYIARNNDLIYPGAGYTVEVTGVSTADALPLQVTIKAFDLGGPIGLPEPSTWAMMLLGVAGLGFVARRRRRSALLQDAPHNSAVPQNLPHLLS